VDGKSGGWAAKKLDMVSPAWHPRSNEGVPLCSLSDGEHSGHLTSEVRSGNPCALTGAPSTQGAATASIGSSGSFTVVSNENYARLRPEFLEFKHLVTTVWNSPDTADTPKIHELINGQTK